MTAAATVTSTHLDGAGDDELVTRVAGRDREAWGELYRRHRAAVARYLIGRAQVEADATDRAKVDADLDDLVQETFLRAWNKPEDYRPELGYPVRSWLRGLAGQVAWQHRRTRWPSLIDATGWDAIEQRPVSVEDRESRPLSAPVRAALERLSPAEQRAVQLRYIDGMRGRDAAEATGSSVSSVNTNAMTARRKLAAALADQAGPAPSPYVDMSRRQAIEAALAAVGRDDVPAARAWLREHGVRVSKSMVYNVTRERRLVAAGLADPVEHHDRRDATRRAHDACRDYRDQHGRLPTATELATAAGISESTARTAIGELTGWQPRRPGPAPGLRERTRAAGLEYRDRRGRLPTSDQLAQIAGVSHQTAARALREITGGPRPRGQAPRQRERAYAAGLNYGAEHGRLPTGAELARTAQVSEHTARTALRQLRDAHTATTTTTSATTSDTTSATTDRHRPAAAVAAAEPTPAAYGDTAERHRPRGTRYGDLHARRTDAAQQATAEPNSHRARVTGQAARATTPAREQFHPATPVGTYASTGAGPSRGDRAAPTTRHTTYHATDEADPAARRPPADVSADVSIARARVAIAVLVAHRAVQAQRQQAQHDHAERGARWQGDDQHRAHATTRSDAEGMCLQ